MGEVREAGPDPQIPFDICSPKALASRRKRDFSSSIRTPSTYWTLKKNANPSKMSINPSQGSLSSDHFDANEGSFTIKPSGTRALYSALSPSRDVV